MDEMVNVTGMNWAGLFEKMTSSDKAFLGFLGMMSLAYLAKLYFDTVGKAMEHGYDATLTSTKNGSMRFTSGNRDHEDLGQSLESIDSSTNASDESM